MKSRGMPHPSKVRRIPINDKKTAVPGAARDPGNPSDGRHGTDAPRRIFGSESP